ncbi:Protein FAM162B [Anthophora quadrimaculata]
MLCTKLTRQLKLLSVRQIHSTFVKNESKPVPETSTTTQPGTKTAKKVVENVIGSPLHTVSNIDKRILVWVKRYPSMEEVPSQVPIETIQRAHTKIRIHICFAMMAFSIIGFYVSVRMGKHDVASGKNILTERAKWYNEVQEKARKEKEQQEANEAL